MATSADPLGALLDSLPPDAPVAAPRQAQPKADPLDDLIGSLPSTPPQKQENPFFGATTTPIKELSNQPPKDTYFDPTGQEFRNHRNVQAYNPPPETARKEKEFVDWQQREGLGQNKFGPDLPELGNAALMGAGEALPMAARAVANPKVANALRAASVGVNGYFAAMMAKDATGRTQQAAEAYKRGDYPEMAARLGQAGMSGLFAALGLKGLADTAAIKEPMGQYQARQSQKPPSQRDPGMGGTQGPAQPDILPNQPGVGSSPGEPPPATDPLNHPGEKTGIAPSQTADNTAQSGAPKSASNQPQSGPIEPAIQAAPPPTNTKTPGPRTPVLPTAAAPTTPETPETLNLQLEQMGTGVRKVVMVPKSNIDAGFEPAAPVPAGVSMTADAFGNRYYYDRQQGVTKSQVHAAVQNNTLPELLGGPVGMGAPDKSAIDPATAVVVRATTPEGVEVQSTATTPEALPQTLAAIQPVLPPGGNVQVEPPAQAVEQRLPQQEPPPTVAPPSPYRAILPQVEPMQAPPRLEAPQPVGAKPAQPAAPPPQPQDFWARRQAREAAQQQPAPPTGPVDEFMKSEEGVFTPGQAAAHIAAVVHPYTDTVRQGIAPQTRGDTAKSGAGTIRNMEGRRMRIEAKAKAAFDGFRDFFQKKSPTFQVNSPGTNGVHAFDVIDAIEHGPAAVAQLDPTSQQFARTMGSEMNHWKGELQKRGLMQQFQDNYFHRSWVPASAKNRAAEFFRGRKPLAGSKQYAKKRAYDYMSDAMQDPNFDLVPKFDNPVDYVLDYVAQAAKHVTAHDVFNEWKNAGYLHFFRSPKDAPIGYSKINDNIFTVYGPKFGAVKLPGSAIDTNTGMPVDPNDVRVYGNREMGSYYAPDELARVANNFLSQGVAATAGAPLYNAWMALKGAQNMLNLGFSAFHGMTTIANSAFSDLALGLRDLSSGNIAQGAKRVGEFATPGRSIVRDMIRGTYLEKVYDGKVSDPMAEAVIQALEMAGGSPHQATWSPDLFLKGMKKSWEEGAKTTAVLKALNPLLWSEQFPVTRFIMEKMVPRVKLAAFERAMAQEVERHPMMGVDEARARFGAIWDSMDNVFGQLNQKNMLMAAPVRDLMNGIMGRPGWTVGNLRMVFGGTADMGRSLFDTNGRELSHRGAQLLASIIGAALINAVISAMVSALNQDEKTPFTWMDLIAPRSGGYTEDGRPARMVLPFYLSKDYRSWVTHPIRTAKAKLTPALMITGDLLENRDFFRHKIYGEGGIGLLNYLWHAWYPYSVSGTIQNLERGQKLGQLIAPQLGVMPASRETSMTKAERLIYDWKQDHQPEMRGATTEHSRARQKVFLAAKKGPEEAAKVSQQYVAQGTLTPKEARDAVARAGKSPLLNDVKYMTGEGAIRTVVKVYDAASEKERGQIKDEVRKKLQNARTKPWEWDAKTRELAKRHFGIEPSRTIGTPSPVGAGR